MQQNQTEDWLRHEANACKLSSDLSKILGRAQKYELAGIDEVQSLLQIEDQIYLLQTRANLVSVKSKILMHSVSKEE